MKGISHLETSPVESSLHLLAVFRSFLCEIQHTAKVRTFLFVTSPHVPLFILTPWITRLRVFCLFFGGGFVCAHKEVPKCMRGWVCCESVFSHAWFWLLSLYWELGIPPLWDSYLILYQGGVTKRSPQKTTWVTSRPIPPQKIHQ